MEILARSKGLLHGGIVGHMGQHPQFDLGIVGIHQHPARTGGKAPADLRAVLPPHRQVLQVGIGRRQAAGGGDRLVEGGADAPVGVDGLGQAVGIGALQLAHLAPCQNGGDDIVLFLELFQGFRIGGITGAGLFAGLQAQFLKQHHAQLLGRADVELSSGQFINLGLQIFDLAFQLLTKLLQPLLVGTDAFGLHSCQHGQQRQLHFPVQGQHALGFQCLFLCGPHGGDQLHMLGQGGNGLLGNAQQIAGVLAVIDGRHGLKAQRLPCGRNQIVAAAVHIQQVSAQFGVKGRIGRALPFLI